MAVLELEGSWEEILKRSAEFAGQRVKVTVLPKETASSPSLDELAQKWLEKGERLEFIPRPPRQGQEAEIQQLIVEKFRRQGLKL